MTEFNKVVISLLACYEYWARKYILPKVLTGHCCLRKFWLDGGQTRDI
jgi:hypothetical protein